MQFWRRVRLFLADRRGNAAIIFAIALVPVIGLMGAAVDYGRSVSAKTHLQEALDAATLAGAMTASTARAQTVFSANYRTSEGALTGPTFALDSGTGILTGSATLVMPSTVLSALGYPDMQVSVTSAAKVASTGAVCVLLLDPSASQALLVNSGATVNAPNCEVHVRSTGSPPAIFNSGSSLKTKRICLAGSTPIYNSVTVANVETRCSAVSDPFAGTLPVPPSSTCTYSNGNYNGGTVTLSPGTYCGWFNFNSSPTVTFQPGTYVIKGGGWNVNGGTWSGSGVTFYFADTSKIQFNSGISATLTAPTSGAYAGLLFYEASGLSKSDFIFNDSVANKLEGLLYLPSRNVTFNAKSGINNDKATLVFNTLILNQTSWNLDVAAQKKISTSTGSAYLVK